MKLASILICSVVVASFGLMLDQARVNQAQINIEQKDENNCWFLSSRGMDSVGKAVLEERQNREDLGYPSDLPISEALGIYNREQKCWSNPGPDLTEDELLSALAIPLDYGSESNWPIQGDIIRKILVSHKLPKGSLLLSEGAGTYQSPIGGSKEIKVKGQRIYLLLNLHENSRYSSTSFAKEQIILIKKTLFGLEGL